LIFLTPDTFFPGIIFYSDFEGRENVIYPPHVLFGLLIVKKGYMSVF
jgi:hypothetical protein